MAGEMGSLQEQAGAPQGRPSKIQRPAEYRGKSIGDSGTLARASIRFHHEWTRIRAQRGSGFGIRRAHSDPPMQAARASTAAMDIASPLPRRYLVGFDPKELPHHFTDVLIIGGG